MGEEGRSGYSAYNDGCGYRGVRCGYRLYYGWMKGGAEDIEICGACGGGEDCVNEGYHG